MRMRDKRVYRIAFSVGFSLAVTPCVSMYNTHIHNIQPCSHIWMGGAFCFVCHVCRMTETNLETFFSFTRTTRNGSCSCSSCREIYKLFMSFAEFLASGCFCRLPEFDPVVTKGSWAWDISWQLGTFYIFNHEVISASFLFYCCFCRYKQFWDNLSEHLF